MLIAGECVEQGLAALAKLGPRQGQVFAGGYHIAQSPARNFDKGTGRLARETFSNQVRGPGLSQLFIGGSLELAGFIFQLGRRRLSGFALQGRTVQDDETAAKEPVLPVGGKDSTEQLSFAASFQSGDHG